MMSGGAHCAERRAVFSGKDAADGVDCGSGGLPGDFCGFRAEYCIGLNATSACSSKPAEFLQMVVCMHQQEVRVCGGDHGATADAIEQSTALQMLFEHGNSNRRFRVITGSVSLKRRI